MNIIGKIGILLILEKIYSFLRFLGEGEEENVVVSEKEEIKDGYRTTEFWLTVVSEIGILVGALGGLIPADVAAAIIAIQTAVYSILRTIAKKY